MAFKMSKAVEEYFGADVLPEDEVINTKVSDLLAEKAALKTERDGLAQDKIDLQAKVVELEKLEPAAAVGGDVS